MMEWRNFVTAKICGMENRIHDLQSNQGGHHGELLKRLDKIERNLRRMSYRGCRWRLVGEERAEVVVVSAEPMRVKLLCQQICASVQRTCMFSGQSLSRVLEATNQLDCSRHLRGGKSNSSTAGGDSLGCN